MYKRQPSKGVNPDEVVAVGAAVQGAVLTDEIKASVCGRRMNIVLTNFKRTGIKFIGFMGH